MLKPYLDLFSMKLETLNLENSIREYEVEVFDTLQKNTQLDFFEPRDLSEKKWQELPHPKSPRPSLLLSEPVPLSPSSVKKIKILSSFPLERIESSWLSKIAKSAAGSWQDRDYYFVLSENGQRLWIFKDRETEKFYLHGYFD